MICYNTDPHFNRFTGPPLVGVPSTLEARKCKAFGLVVSSFLPSRRDAVDDLAVSKKLGGPFLVFHILNTTKTRSKLGPN